MMKPANTAPLLRKARCSRVPSTQYCRAFSTALQSQRPRLTQYVTKRKYIESLYGLRPGFSSAPTVETLVARNRSHLHTSGARQADATESDRALSRTALHDLHVQNGGKMVPFGGYSMPVQYADLSVGDSHRWTREKCSLFDVGHMVQHHFSGPGAAAFLEKLTPFSSASLQPNHSTLSCLLHPATGGVVDDTVITRLGPELFYVVTNAGCRQKDLAYLSAECNAWDKSQGAVEWKVRENWGLIALQGPLSVEVLQRVLETLGVIDVDLQTLYFGQCVIVGLPGLSSDSPPQESGILISRGGYTGEDGFEISVPPEFTLEFTQQILEAGGNDRVRLAGLGARDSLRLEAGMCLYGHDLNDDTTPVEGGLSWVVHKDRRAAGGFYGDETILRQLRPAKDGGGVRHRRVGLIVHGAPAREGAEINTVEDSQGAELVGNVTSGCPSPTLGKNIAMGYVKDGMHKSGTKLTVMVRGKIREAEVVKMPFVASKYWKQASGISPG